MSSVGLGFRMEICRDRKCYIGSSESSIITNLVKTRIDKSQGDALCIVYRKVDDGIDSSG